MLRLGERGKGIAIYTVLWLICALFLLKMFQINGRAFFWLGDGICQHFASFSYLCDYLKDLICNQHFPGFYNFTLGQGMDVLTTLNSYDFTDPVSALCALVFPLARTTRYTLMVFAKLYLVGLAFIFYCYTIDRKDALSVAAGAIAYVFSSAILFMAVRHPNFINWGYFLPLLLGGIELYFRKDKKNPLILFVFLNVLTSYYTFYVDVILVGIYVLVHAICNIIEGRNSISSEGKKVLGLVGIFSIGILLASFIFFPAIHAFLNNARVAGLSGYTDSAWHYSVNYYENLFRYIFAAYRDAGYTSYIGLNAVMIVPLIFIFIKKGEHTALKSLLAISFLMMCIPFAGRIMNGFGYASNRWAFAIPFYVSVAFVFMFTEINCMEKKDKGRVLFFTLFYISLCLLISNIIRTDMNLFKDLTPFMLLAVVVVLVLTQRYRRSNYVILFLVFLGSCFQVYFMFSKDAGNYSRDFVRKSSVNSRINNWSGNAAKKLEDGFYRVEMEEAYPTAVNTTAFTGNKGTGIWWSVVPSYVMGYYTDLALDSVIQNCKACSLDGRTGLLSLASVKYYTRPNKKIGLVPYGYKEIATKDKRYQIFKNQYALPVGYTYSSYITADAYQSMNGIEKEQALLQGAVLDAPISGYIQSDALFDYKVLDYEIIKADKLYADNGGMRVNTAPGTITMKTVVPNGSEIYLYAKGIKLGKDRSEVWLNVTRKAGDYSVTKSTRISNLNYAWPVLRNDVAFNLGYGHAGANTIILTFYGKCNISYDDLQIIAVPMVSYVNQVKKLREYVLENINIESDKITGTISLPEDRILQLSMPYSDGWKALVDGKEETILKSNVMYMAIPLTAGSHTIELIYRTPYMREGFIATGITIILWALYEFLRRNKRRHDSQVLVQ